MIEAVPVIGPKPPPVVRPVFPCVICGAPFDTSKARAAHFADAHPVQVRGATDEDGESTDDGEWNAAPRRAAIPERPAVHWFRCSVCGRNFDSKNGRSQHIRMTHRHRIGTCTLAKCAVCYGDKPTAPEPARETFACDDCDIRPFTTVRSMLVHRAIAHNAPWPPRDA